jgi:hypothetical protein
MCKGEEGGCVDQGDRTGEYGVCRKRMEQEVFGEGDRGYSFIGSGRGSVREGVEHRSVLGRDGQ